MKVPPGGSVPLPVSLTNPPSQGGVTVMLSSSDPSKATVSPDSVYFPPGSTSPFALPRVTGNHFGSAVITASAFGLTGSSQTVQVSENLTGPPNQVIQLGSTLNMMLSLGLPTPDPVALALKSDNPAVASVPATSTIPAGGTTAIVPVAGLSAGTTVIHASALPDVPDFAVTIVVFSAGTINLSAVPLTLGQSLPFPVTLGAPSTGAGVTVNLASSEPTTVAIAPSSVFIPAGRTTPLTQPEIMGGNIGAATITVSAPGYLTASQQIPVTATITMSPTTLALPVGGTRLLSLILSAAAPSVGVPITPDRAAGGFVNGLTVSLTSTDPRIAAVQPTVQFYPDGSSITTVVVVVNGVGPGTAIIRAGAPPYIPDAAATVIVGSPPAGAASITATAGTPQSAQVNTPFGLPLSARVLDAASNPVTGATVTFLSPGSGPGAAFAGGLNTAVTDSSGIARSATLTANGTAGSYQIAASVAGVATPALFTLTNLPAATAAIILPANVAVGPNQSLPFPVTLSAPAPAGVTVALTSTDPGKAAISASSVFIPAGAIAPASQPLVTGVDFGSATIGASALGYASASQLVQVKGTLSFAPASLSMNGPGTQNLTLNLSSPAPANGLLVTLSCDNPSVAMVLPSVKFAANATTVTVPVVGAGAGSATITATATVPNVQAATAGVTVSSVSGIALTAGVNVAPGESVPMPLFLTSPARPGGVTVSLSSSDTSKVTVSPTTLYIPEGLTSPFLQPQVTGGNFGSASITASAYGLTGSSQVVQVIGKLSGPPAQTVQKGSTANVVFALSWPTPAPVTLAVSSDNPAVAKVPATVTIPASGTLAVVTVEGIAAGTTVIHAGALPAIAESTVTITVQAPGTITLASGVSVPLGQSAALPVTLGTPAPAGGLVVALSSSSPATVSISPSSVYIPAGSKVPAAQPVVTGNNIGGANITASAPGYLSATQLVAVTATITMSPSTLVIPAGGTGLLAMALSAAAPSSGPITPDRGAGGFVDGLTVLLSSSDPRIATVQPSVQFYPDGSSITTVVVVVNGAARGTAVIHAGAPPFIPDVTATVVVQ